MEIDVKMNPVYLPYLERPQFIQIFFGGSSSGKSYFLAQKIVLDNLNGVNWLCCRNVAAALRRSTFNEVYEAIVRMGLGEYYQINHQEMVMTNRLNGKQILFLGLDDPEKVKSIKPRHGVLERIFVEEATEIKRAAFQQLKKRLRGMTPHQKCIILAFNPILKSHWIYQEFFGGWRDDRNYYEDQDLLILKTTYRDNLFLTAADRRLLEEEKDPYFYDVYTLGNWGILGNVIFKHWHVEDLRDKIPQFDRIYNGLDFGYALDPNALVRVHLDKKHKRIYVFDEWYQAGMSDEALLRVCRQKIGSQYVVCDSAEPKTIDFLCQHGIRAVGAVKGADSINRGIRWLQDYEIVIDVHCQHFKNEIEQYHWLEDRQGNVMAKAADMNNHLIDALRYALCDEILAAEVRAALRI